MARLHALAGHRFRHAGQDYVITALATDDGWAVIGSRITAAGGSLETGHRAYLPSSATDTDLQAAIGRLQHRIEAGDAPDEEPWADTPNTAFDL